MDWDGANKSFKIKMSKLLNFLTFLLIWIITRIRLDQTNLRGPDDVGNL